MRTHLGTTPTEPEQRSIWFTGPVARAPEGWIHTGRRWTFKRNGSLIYVFQTRSVHRPGSYLYISVMLTHEPGGPVRYTFAPGIITQWNPSQDLQWGWTDLVSRQHGRSLFHPRRCTRVSPESCRNHTNVWSFRTVKISRVDIDRNPEGCRDLYQHPHQDLHKKHSRESSLDHQRMRKQQ